MIRCLTGSFKRKFSNITSNDKVSAFRRQLLNPDHVYIRAIDAKKQYGLSDADLGSLPYVEKEDPYHSDRVALKSYTLPDIVRTALQ